MRVVVVREVGKTSLITMHLLSAYYVPSTVPNVLPPLCHPPLSR